MVCRLQYSTVNTSINEKVCNILAAFTSVPALRSLRLLRCLFYVSFTALHTLNFQTSPQKMQKTDQNKVKSLLTFRHGPGQSDY
jgi:hypothetical protein